MSQSPPPWRPQLPYAPPPPPAPWYRQARYLILAGIIGALVLTSVGLGIFIATLPTTAATTSGALPTATTRPQTAPTATPTLDTQSVLGGLTSVFNAAYPQSSATFGNVSATFTGSDGPGSDGQSRITGLHITFSTAPSEAGISQFLAHFFPADAKHIADTTTTNSTFHVYRSAALANAFIADAFITESNNLAPAGSFSWNPDSPTSVYLALGTN